MVAIDASMVVLALCRLTIAVVSMTGWAALAPAVLVLFLFGTLLLLFGLVFSAIDIFLARRAIAFEADRALHLAREP